MKTTAVLEPTARSDPPARVQPVPAQERVVSIDVLRGFDMFWISGGEHFFHALAVATGWWWATGLSHQLSHSKWEGFTFYDLIQPLFLFITGLTLPLTVLRRRERGHPTSQILRRLAIRTVLLIVIGHIDKNGALSFDLANLRYTSVLGRIGVASFAAAILLLRWPRPRTLVLWIVALLAGYWALLTFVPAPSQPAPSYAQGANIVDYLDQYIMPGKLRSGNHDANGWFSTPPVVATVLFGALAGMWLLSARSALRKVGGLAAGGALLVLLGWSWGYEFPIIKHIWTSSYVLYSAGWSCLLLAASYGIVDALGWRRWAIPFQWIGVNPLVIYILLSTGLINFQYIADFFLGFAYLPLSKPWAAVGQSAAAIAVEFAFLYYLFRRKLFWRV